MRLRKSIFKALSLTLIITVSIQQLAFAIESPQTCLSIPIPPITSIKQITPNPDSTEITKWREYRRGSQSVDDYEYIKEN
jgi:hypothetical protein